MPITRPARRRLGVATIGLLTIALVPGLAQMSAVAASRPTPKTVVGAVTDNVVDTSIIHTLADSVPGLANLDLRGKILPSLAQKRAAAKLDTASLRWNAFGTPESILPSSGFLGQGYSTKSSAAPAAARDYLRRNHVLFGLSLDAVKDLTLVNNQAFADSPARAVLFRQDFGALSPALDSMVTVGVSHGKIDYVSSSLTRNTPSQLAQVLQLEKGKLLTPLQGWLAAATNVGKTVPALDLPQITSTLDRADGFLNISVPSFSSTLQQARMRTLSMSDGSIRPVIEANVVDGQSAFAYTIMVDAVTGRVLHRENMVENDNDSAEFSGVVTAATCGPLHQFMVKDSATKNIAAVAAEGNTANDIVLKLFDPSGTLLTSSDSATSPEALTYSASSIPKGIYAIQVCPFASPTVPFVGPGNYVASATTSNTATPDASSVTSSLKSRFRYFTTAPTADSATQTPHNSVIGCWIASTGGCTDPNGALRNVQAPGPWDTVAATGLSTMTTIGNNANTHEAWLDPDAPGGTAQAPISLTQDYTTPFTDAWNNSKCNPANLVPGGNDILAAVTNLFSGHNKVHDYAYYLGFNERNYNLQLDDLGRGGTAGDQETGNVQAGAIDGGYPEYLGRDNANQIALQDGVPGITNQYLFQPIAGSFYAPCTDGDLDFGIFGHEYTHAISNRMVGGPDEGLTSDQGGAMGESWSDLNAAQFQYSHGYGSVKQVFSVGTYATNNKKVAIRDYAIPHNPLNYSDYAFDTPGAEVHADGEIWNGTQWSVRQALVKKYDKQYPTTNKTLELKCSNAGRNKGVRRPNKCPGDRRWIQMIYDAWLLQPGATSMLTARDAMLASDKMRFGGKDLKVMWDAFAARGMGKGATTTPDSAQPHSIFASPTSKNAQVTFKTPGSQGTVYVGHYEARVTPAADTTPKTKLKNKLAMVAGTYEMTYVSRKTGFKRFTLKVKAGQNKTMVINAPKNYASGRAGAKVISSTAGSLNASSLIDDTEATNWGGVTAANVDASHPYVAVKLAGGTHTIKRVEVSAYLHPASASDADAGSRFTALRQFELLACVKNCAASSAVWKRVYVSPASAFPAVDPRPVAPNLTLRSFKTKPFKAAAIKFMVLNNQCTGYAGYAGNQSNDPTSPSDCSTGSDRGTIVHAAEFEAFTK